jgi:hypothetical protein
VLLPELQDRATAPNAHLLGGNRGGSA